MDYRLTLEQAYDSDELIGFSGGMFSHVYLTPDDTVLMFTPDYSKVLYFRYLGIIVAEHGYCYTHSHGERQRVYRLELVKLIPLEALNHRQTASIYAEVDRFKQNWRNPDVWDWQLNEVLKEDTEQWPIMRTVIEFLRQYGKRIPFDRFDLHEGNFLVCPVTGKVFATDPIVFDECREMG